MERAIYFGGVIPAVVGLVVVALGLLKRPREIKPGRVRDPLACRLPLLFAGLFVLAFVVSNGWLRDKWHVLVFVPIIGAAVGCVMSFTPRTWWLRGGMLVILAAATGYVARDLFVESDPMLVKIAPTAGSLILLLALEPLAVRRAGPVVAGAIALATGTMAVLILESGQISLAVPLGAMAVALAMAAVYSLFQPTFTVADGAIAVVAPTLAASAAVRWAYFEAESGGISAMWAWAFALVVAAPLVAWLGEVKPLRSRPIVGTIIPLVIVAAICACAVVMVMPPKADDGGSAADSMYSDYGY